MNGVDLLLLVVLVSVTVRGYRQGALSQVTRFGGAMAGLVAGAALAPRLARGVVDYPGPLLALLTLGVLFGCLLLGQGLGFSAGLRLRRVARDAGAGGPDRVAGIAVGLGGLLLAVWLVAAVLVQGPSPAVARQVRSSQIVRLVDAGLPPAPDVVARVGTYLDQQGFPQVFTGPSGGIVAPPVGPPQRGAVAVATRAGQASTVQIQATGCGALSSGSGFVPRAGYVVTNAHVIAGSDRVSVRDAAGVHRAVPVHYDDDLDLAVLAAPGLSARPIPWVTTPADRGVAGSTLGFPGGRRQLVVRPATVRQRIRAVGRDIYGGGLVARDVLTLSAPVRQGDSGGPFVTSAGRVGGVVFAAAADDPEVGYALTAERVRPEVDRAVTSRTPVATGSCRY